MRKRVGNVLILNLLDARETRSLRCHIKPRGADEALRGVSGGANKAGFWVRTCSAGSFSKEVARFACRADIRGGDEEIPALRVEIICDFGGWNAFGCCRGEGKACFASAAGGGVGVDSAVGDNRRDGLADPGG